MKEAIEVLLLVALLKFLGVPMAWVGIGCFLCAFYFVLCLFDALPLKGERQD